ncbi:2Fe-2S ferredoxin, partial [Rhodococcus rhodochrous]
MSVLDPLYRRWPDTWPVRPIDPDRWAAQQPTYRGARPELISAVLDRAQRRPSGNWYVVAAGREIGADRPFGITIAGIELVAWRDGDRVLV